MFKLLTNSRKLLFYRRKLVSIQTLPSGDTRSHTRAIELLKELQVREGPSPHSSFVNAHGINIPQLVHRRVVSPRQLVSPTRETLQAWNLAQVLRNRSYNQRLNINTREDEHN
jgi:hypothetical protein